MRTMTETWRNVFTMSPQSQSGWIRTRRANMSASPATTHSGVVSINFNRLPAGVTAEDIRATAATLSEEQVRDLLYCWDLWSRGEQEWPVGDWRTWLIMAGRGFGKTRTGAETVRQVVGRCPRQRIALIGPTAGDCREVMVEGESGLLNVFPPPQRPTFEPSKRRITFYNGSGEYLYSAEEPERLRGPQHHFAYCDEIATYEKFQDVWTNLRFGLGLGRGPRVVATTTPKPVKWLQELIADPGTVVTRGSTYDNRANLPASQLAYFERVYGGRRIGRQELGGEVLGGSEGALWSR